MNHRHAWSPCRCNRAAVAAFTALTLDNRLPRRPDAAGEQPYSEEERKARPPRPPSAAAADGDAHKYDSHNLHR